VSEITDTKARKFSSQDVADALDVRIQTVHDWAKRGCPHTPGRGRNPARYDLAEVASWMKDNKLTGRQGRPAESEDSPDLEKARLRKENALASKYELQVARERRTLVPTDEIKELFMEVVSRAKSQMSGLPADVAGACVGLDAGDIQVLLESRVTQILNDLATGLNQ
jgi:phage terminase Nu1 subunit (DNA packaging protein)